MKYKLLTLASVGLFGICQAFQEEDSSIFEPREELSLERELFQLERAAIESPKAHSRGEDDFFDRDRERRMPIKPLADEPESKKNGKKFLGRNCQYGKCQSSLSLTRNDQSRIRKDISIDEKLQKIKSELDMLTKSLDRTKGKIRRRARTNCNNKICIPRDDRPIKPFNAREYYLGQPKRAGKFVIIRNDDKNQVIKESQISVHFGFGMTRPSPTGHENIIPGGHRQQCRKLDCTCPHHRHFPSKGPSNYLESLFSAQKLASKRQRQYHKQALSKYPEPNPPIENDNPHDSIDIPNLRPPYEKPRLTDPKHSNSWYNIVKEKIKVWVRTIKDTFNGMYKGFEKEPVGNKIAMILVIGLIAFLQISIAIKAISFLGKDYAAIPSHYHDDNYGVDNADDGDEKADLENSRKRVKWHSSK